MSMTAEKKRFLVEHLGAAEADRIEQELAAVEQQLVSAGVRHKEQNAVVAGLKERAQRGDRAAPYVLDLITKGATR